LAHIKRWKQLFWVAAFGSFLFLGTMRHKPPSTNVASTPNQYAIEIKALQNSTAFGHQYLVKTEHKESVLLQTSLENRFLVGERYLVHGTLVPIAPPKNPTDFDFKSYMHRKGISRKLMPTNDVFVFIGLKWSLKSWAFAVQQNLIERLKETSLHHDSKGLVMALVLGNKKEFSEVASNNINVQEQCICWRYLGCTLGSYCCCFVI
jgi:predicted membrane metal-binding protein